MLGFSVYSQDYDKDYIDKMVRSGIKDVFISLHVNEEINNKEKIVEFLNFLNGWDLNIIADISPIAFEVFTIEELKSYNITKVRLDFGFSLDQTIELSKDFELVLNASTVNEEEIIYLKEKGLDLSKVEFLHNFYPKVETGLSLEQFLNMNKVFEKYNIKISSFIPGDGKLRGPINEGLPTIEEQRDQDLLLNYLEMKKYCENIYIGDISIQDSSIEKIKNILDNKIYLEIENINLDEKFLNIPLKIRRDSNHLNIRIEDSRTILKTIESIKESNCISREKGFITQDNYLSKRYNGEIMISKKELPQRKNLNIVAKIKNKHIQYIDYITDEYKIILKEEH